MENLRPIAGWGCFGLDCSGMRGGHTWIKAVVELAPFVQPHVDQARIVVVDDLRRAARKRVRRRLAEHVTDARARQDFEHTAAHPHLFFFGFAVVVVVV